VGVYLILKYQEKILNEKTFWFFVIFSILLSLLFAVLSGGPVFDGKIHYEDIFHYINKGISLETIKAQTNPQAPGVYLFLTLLSKITGASFLSFRMVILIFWGIFFWILKSSVLIENKKESALVALAIATHSYFGLTSGSIMTEVFALLCSVFAIFYLNREKWWSYLLSGLYLAFAFYCRQYYLAVIGAILLTVFLENPKNLRWAILSFVPFAGILGLYLIWGGLVPPVVRQIGIPHSGLGTSLGINPLRPLAAIFYVGLYMIPFIPWSVEILKSKKFIFSSILGFILALISTIFIDNVLASGPLYSILKIVQSKMILHRGSFFLVAYLSQTTSIYSLWTGLERFKNKKMNRLEMICFFTLILYVLEQFGIKGNLPHFERYTLQVYFFSTYMLVRVNPFLSISRAFLLLITFGFSQYILWKQFLSV
jgi:hypothetical protein